MHFGVLGNRFSPNIPSFDSYLAINIYTKCTALNSKICMSTKNTIWASPYPIKPISNLSYGLYFSTGIVSCIVVSGPSAGRQSPGMNCIHIGHLPSGWNWYIGYLLFLRTQYPIHDAGKKHLKIYMSCQSI